MPRYADVLYDCMHCRAFLILADVWRDTPLCMSQYRRLFGAHRKAVVDDADEMRVCEVVDDLHIRTQVAWCMSEPHDVRG